MRDLTQWQDSAAEEALERALRNSMEICSQINRDLNITHKKLDMLKYSWKTIYNILQQQKKENILNDIIKPEDNKTKRLPSIDDYITSPVRKY